ncbi:MAG: GAF domain-containing protein [Acidobacteria bacterium]|nr:GAF domain-containing protein [Acidobacteriota bacterium]
MSLTIDDTIAGLQRTIAELERKLNERSAELKEALEQQTATAEVLQVINNSQGDLAPVFDAMLEKAMRLCEAAFGGLWIFDQDHYIAVALRGVPKPYAEFLAKTSLMPGPGTGAYRLRCGERVVHNVDLVSEEPYRFDDPQRRALVDLGGARTALQVALRKENDVLGVITVYRQEIRPFSENQITLLQSFATQAVIAIENARLLTETRQALEQQAATAEIVQVINSSPGDLTPVFDAMLERATRLCEAGFGILWIYDGERFRAAALHGVPAAYAEFLAGPINLADSAALGDIARGRSYVHVPDLASPGNHSKSLLRQATIELGGARTGLAVPIHQNDTLLGIFVIYRQEVRPFSERQISLLQNFSAQAVIAIENARLLTETREALEQQTATAEVLQVINSSPGDLAPVFDAMLKKAARICQADSGFIFRLQDGLNRMVAAFGVPAEYKEFQACNPIPLGRGTLAGRTALKRRAVHIVDAAADPEYTRAEAVQIGGQRTMLGVPLIREDALIGVITFGRSRVEPFTEKQIALVATFADQAVIAIENARLFDEIRQRQAELRVTFDNMGDGVAMFDTGLRLAAWNMNFQQLLDLPDAFLAERPDYESYVRYLAGRGEFGSEALEAELSRRLEDTNQELRFERIRPDGRVIEVRRNAVPSGGFVLMYSDVTERRHAEAEIRAARDAAEKALVELKAAQASLIHAEKMASLGQLTAGIAHEIKNPLNFVNNFAGLSVELLDELKGMARPGIATLDADTQGEIDETIDMLTGNLDKIAEHGRRADGIVQSMLAHSRGSSGERRTVDLNELVDEAVNLAYHGARAQDQNFNIALERDFVPAIPGVELVPQDITRVLINLIGNGFDAARQRHRESNDPGFQPVLKVTTRDLGNAVEVRIRDNGTGIKPEHRNMLFQPFFTTKPTGKGTGLGLSISYDIVTQQHGGTITVDSRVGEFTEFTVRLPCAYRATTAEAAS